MFEHTFCAVPALALGLWVGVRRPIAAPCQSDSEISLGKSHSTKATSFQVKIIVNYSIKKVKFLIVSQCKFNKKCMVELFCLAASQKFRETTCLQRINVNARCNNYHVPQSTFNTIHQLHELRNNERTSSISDRKHKVRDTDS